MPFVNEVISQEDRIKYNLDNIAIGLFRDVGYRDWTVDKESNTYLRYMAGSRDEEGTSSRTWLFSWKGVNCVVDTFVAERGHEKTGKYYIKYGLRNINISAEYEFHRDEILLMLKEALVAYGEAGYLSRASISIQFSF